MGWGLGNFVYTTRPFLSKKPGWDITVIYFGAFIGVGGLRNFVHTTRPLFNKKLGWDKTVIYLGAFIRVGDWEILYIQDLYFINS